MTDRDHSERNEAAILEVFDNQFPTLTSQVIDNLQRLSLVGERWPTTLLIFSGALLLFATLALKLMLIIVYTGDTRTQSLLAVEFTTLILAASGLMFVGTLFKVYQARSWRKIVLAQQVVGTEILNKQIDIAKGVVVRRHEFQREGMILLPAKIRRRHHR